MPDALPAKQERALPPISEEVTAGLGLNDAEIELVKDYFEKTQYHPIFDLVLECQGHACKYYSKCILGKINKLPEFGADCPIERGLITVWTERLLHNLEVNPVDVVDQAQVREIVALYVFERRAYIGHLSKEPMVLDALKNIAFDGTAISELQLHPILRQLEGNHKVIMRLRNSLISTRESKVKAGETIIDDKMKMLGDLVSKAKSAMPIIAEVKTVNGQRS